MRRILLAAVVGLAIGAGALALAQQGYQGPEKMRTLSERDVVEILDGKKARVTTQEVIFEPGQAGLPHRHAGPIFGYVLEGEFEIGLGEEPRKTLKAGETFYEPSGVVHSVARNPSTKTKTRVLAVVLHPRDAKEIAGTSSRRAASSSSRAAAWLTSSPAWRSTPARAWPRASGPMRSSKRGC